MLPLRYVRHWRVASVALLLLVFAATLLPVVWFLVDPGLFADWFIDADKWLHAATFAFLAIWFAGQYHPRSYWRIGLSLLLFGLLIEGCQRLIIYRSAEWFDIGADAAGIIVGLVIANAGLGGWCVRFENWYSRRKASNSVD